MCKKLTLDEVCLEHKAEYERRKSEARIKRSKIADSKRGTSSQRGYDSKWRKARKGFIANNPFCVICKNEGVIYKADVVDHIIPHKGNKELFWDRDNWQPLCYRHHSIKTATEDGGFGHKARGLNDEHN